MTDYKALTNAEQNNILKDFGYFPGFNENKVEEIEIEKFEIFICFDVGEKQITLPTKKAVCYRCNGTGTHTNPNIDGNGITSSEMEELGEDFRYDYMRGVYDITCLECKGQNVVTEIDEEEISNSLNTKLRQAYILYVKHQESLADMYAEMAMERRYLI